jgi:hypothetical protein
VSLLVAGTNGAASAFSDRSVCAAIGEGRAASALVAVLDTSPFEAACCTTSGTDAGYRAAQLDYYQAFDARTLRSYCLQ